MFSPLPSENMAHAGRLEEAQVREYQKWDYITLADFTSSSCGKVFSYGWLWFLAILSVAVYASDTFTAINLIVFQKWPSQINPAIPFYISRWIFASCILFSWVLCIFEWVRAIRVMKRANVAESYLDPLAATLQSMLVTAEGRGWRRFLVFAALTKSKKGADYIALFSYFQFKGAVRILLAEGPRQLVNALTLYSVMKADLVHSDHDADDTHPPFVQFWLNVEILAKQHHQEAVILFTMLFTLIVWVVSFLSFVVACVAYLSFLWRYIPSQDGSLGRYCRRKVDQRLKRIVNVKAKKAIARLDEREQKREEKAERAARKKGELPLGPSRRPTLPDLSPSDDSLSEKTGAQISRQATFTTDSSLSRFNSFASSSLQQSALPDLDADSVPPMPSRTYTQSSVVSKDSSISDLPLLNGAASMGQGAHRPARADSRGPYPQQQFTSLPSSTVPPLQPLQSMSRPPPSHGRLDSQTSGAAPRQHPRALPRLQTSGPSIPRPDQGIHITAARYEPPVPAISPIDTRIPTAYPPTDSHNARREESFELQPPRRGAPLHARRPPPPRSYSEPPEERHRPPPPPPQWQPPPQPQHPAAFQPYRPYSPQAPNPPPQGPLPQRPGRQMTR